LEEYYREKREQTIVVERPEIGFFHPDVFLLGLQVREYHIPQKREINPQTKQERLRWGGVSESVLLKMILPVLHIIEREKCR